MKTLLRNPFLAIRPAARGWEIVSRPGPMADLLIQMAGPSATNGHSPRYEVIEGEPAVVIPLTGELDDTLIHLVDALITLRYESGQVQFTLDLEGISR